MFIMTNNIKVKKGSALEVAERFKKAKGILTFDGFIKMEVLLSIQNEEHDELAIRTSWQNEEAFEKWIKSDSFKHAHSGSREKKESNSLLLGNYFTKQEFLFEHEKQIAEEVK